MLCSANSSVDLESLPNFSESGKACSYPCYDFENPRSQLREAATVDKTSVVLLEMQKPVFQDINIVGTRSLKEQSINELERSTMQLHSTVERIWVEHPQLAYVPAVVISRRDDGQTTVQLDSGETLTLSVKIPLHVVPSCLSGVPDLLSLGQFDLGPILHNVRLRYFRNEIYTAIGQPIIISINPYESISKLYSASTTLKYRTARCKRSSRALPVFPTKTAEQYKSNKNYFTNNPQPDQLSPGHLDYTNVQSLYELPPHPFRVAQIALNRLFTYGTDQSIIISGESGAGKTETTKIILGYLTETSGTHCLRVMSPLERENLRREQLELLGSSMLVEHQKLLEHTVNHQKETSPWFSRHSTGNYTIETNHPSSPGSPVSFTSIERYLTESNHLLESFGNAKTVRNDNSSRFGKFTQITFDLATEKIQGAQITNYLLEKSRIIRQQSNERNYHIFYQLCAGRELFLPELKEMLQLKDPSEFRYLKQCTSAETIDDVSDFEHLLVCLRRMEFQDDIVERLFRLLAGILHLGNVDITPKAENSNKKAAYKDFVSDAETFEHVCVLFGVTPEALLNLIHHKSIVDALSKRKINVIRTEVEVDSTKGAIAKAIYERLFIWLVSRINGTLSKSFDNGSNNVLTKSQMLSKQAPRRFSICQQKLYGNIGLLDIFGFEVFDLNSFEQLCINFANETLQRHFNLNMFHEEQELYAKEGIDWTTIVFSDNQKVLEALTDRMYGIFPMLDSECLIPKSTDQTFLSKIFQASKESESLITFSGIKRNEQFGVKHYAGPVIYSPKGLLDKNRDRIHQDVYDCFQNAECNLLKLLFQESNNGTENTNNQLSAENTMSSMESGVRTGFTQTSVSYRFRKQLDHLVNVLGMTTASYVRCIKPNSERAALLFDSHDVLRQLKCAGILESIRIRKDGYPVRLDISLVGRRYKALLNKEEMCIVTNVMSSYEQHRKIVEQLLLRITEKIRLEKHVFMLPCGSCINLDDVNLMWQIGKTKVFMKDYFQQYLEKLAVQEWDKKLLIITKHWKMFIARRKYRKTKEAALVLQSWMQFQTLRRSFLQHIEVLNEAAQVIQFHWTCYKDMKKRGLEQFQNQLSCKKQQCVSSDLSDAYSDDSRIQEGVYSNAQGGSKSWNRATDEIEQDEFSEKSYNCPNGYSYSEQAEHPKLVYNESIHERPELAYNESIHERPQKNITDRRARDVPRLAVPQFNSFDCSTTYNQDIPSSQTQFMYPINTNRLQRNTNVEYCSHYPSDNLHASDFYTMKDRAPMSSRIHTARQPDRIFHGSRNSEYHERRSTISSSDEMARLLNLFQKEKEQSKAYKEEVFTLQNNCMQMMNRIAQLEMDYNKISQKEKSTRLGYDRVDKQLYDAKIKALQQDNYMKMLKEKHGEMDDYNSNVERELNAQSAKIQMLLEHIEMESNANNSIKAVLEEQVNKLQEDLNHAYAELRAKKSADRRSPSTLSSDMYGEDTQLCMRPECQQTRSDFEELRQRVENSIEKNTLKQRELYMKAKQMLNQLRTIGHQRCVTESPIIDHITTNISRILKSIISIPLLSDAESFKENTLSPFPKSASQRMYIPTYLDSDNEPSLTQTNDEHFLSTRVPSLSLSKDSLQKFRTRRCTVMNIPEKSNFNVLDPCPLTSRTIMTTPGIRNNANYIQL